MSKRMAKPTRETKSIKEGKANKMSLCRLYEEYCIDCMFEGIYPKSYPAWLEEFNKTLDK